MPTDFPKKGDDKKVALRNSEYPQFDRSFAENLKADHPDIWAKGGNIRGNEAYEYWGKARAGDESDGVIAWIKEREAWAARHFEDFRIAGVIAQIKWGVIGSRGQQYMKDLVKEEIDKAEGKAMSTNITKNYAGVTKAVGERQIRVIVSTGDIDREGDIIDPVGIDFAAYKSNPVVLFQHDHDEPIAKCEQIGVVKGRVEALVQFPPEGVNPKSDEVYGLIKAGVLNAVSIGFIPKSWAPIEGSKFGRRFTTCECIEFSVVSVPANANALIIERKIDMTDIEEKTVSLWNLEEMLELLRELSWLASDQKFDETYDVDGEEQHFGAELTAWLNDGKRIFAAMAAALPESKSVKKDDGACCPMCGQPMPAEEDGCKPKKDASDTGSVLKAGASISKVNRQKLEQAKALLDEVMGDVPAVEETPKGLAEKLALLKALRA